MKLRTRYVFRSPSIAFPYLMLGKKLTSSALRRNTFHFLPRISTEVDKITYAIHGPRIFSFENISLSLFLSALLPLVNHETWHFLVLTIPTIISKREEVRNIQREKGKKKEEEKYQRYPSR